MLLIEKTTFLFLCYFTTLFSLRLIVQSELDVPTFATRRLHAYYPEAEGGTVSEKYPVILPKCRFTLRDLLHAVKLRHENDGFTSPPKEGVLRIFTFFLSDGFGRV
jgi:hypothetical protein